MTIILLTLILGVMFGILVLVMRLYLFIDHCHKENIESKKQQSAMTLRMIAIMKGEER